MNGDQELADRATGYVLEHPQYGFGIALISLITAGFAIATNGLWLVPIAAAAMLWGHYRDAENVMTIPSMVASPRYRAA